jgi:hypothetical protein
MQENQNLQDVYPTLFNVVTLFNNHRRTIDNEWSDLGNVMVDRNSINTLKRRLIQIFHSSTEKITLEESLKIGRTLLKNKHETYYQPNTDYYNRHHAFLEQIQDEGIYERHNTQHQDLIWDFLTE